MNSNKKLIPASGVPQSFKGQARQFKPVVAQLKTGVSAHSVKRPVAPPVYRPQPVPRVLQTKRSPGQSPQSLQPPRQPVAPPVYRPEAGKIVQPKATLPQQRPRTPASVYGPEQKRIAQPKMTSSAPVYRPAPTQVKAPPAQAAQTRSVIQRDLADDLQAKRINVAIVGEHHHEIKEDEEIAEWGKHGIRVFYEADPLTDSGGSALVTPDPSLLRLTFAWTTLVERVGPYLEKVSKPGVAAVPGFDDADFVLTYLIPILINDLRRLRRQDKAFGEAVKMLKELRDLLKGGKSQALAGGEELAKVSLARKLRRDLETVGKLIGDVHSKSPFKAVAYRSLDLRVERSRQMLHNVNQFAGAMEKTIYKVGNDHVLDMRQHQWPVGPGVGVFNRQQYFAEYQSLKRKPAKPSASAVAVVSRPGASAVVGGSSASARPSAGPVAVVSSPPSVRPSASPVAVVSSPSVRPSASPVAVVSRPSAKPSASPVAVMSSPPSVKPGASAVAVASRPSVRPSASPVAVVSNPSSRLRSSPERPKKKGFSVAPARRARPAWVPDASRPNCIACDAEFGLFTRRHHCRVCGEVFCSKCCSEKKNVPADEQAVEPGKSPAAGPVLVCHGCL